mgnify:CR=1 FL=1
MASCAGSRQLHVSRHVRLHIGEPMSEVVTPKANRLRAPSWRDSRLLFGLLLIVLSTALGGWAMSRADQTVPLYAADVALVPGQELGPDQLRRVDVRLGDGATAYLSAAQALPKDAHVLRPLNPGELVPEAAVGASADVDTRIVAVPVDVTAASLLTTGSVVDVFVNRPSGTSVGGKPGYAGPELLVERVIVAAVPESGAVLGGSSARRAVHLVIPEDKVKTLVADMDLESRITLVPAPGGVRREGS